jgi:hypothetical protein
MVGPTAANHLPLSGKTELGFRQRGVDPDRTGRREIAPLGTQMRTHEQCVTRAAPGERLLQDQHRLPGRQCRSRECHAIGNQCRAAELEGDCLQHSGILQLRSAGCDADQVVAGDPACIHCNAAAEQFHIDRGDFGRCRGMIDDRHILQQQALHAASRFEWECAHLRTRTETDFDLGRIFGRQGRAARQQERGDDGSDSSAHAGLLDGRKGYIWSSWC